MCLVTSGKTEERQQECRRRFRWSRSVTHCTVHRVSGKPDVYDMFA